MLAALGIYGVISYSVAQKTQEIGVRMALGATAGRVMRDVSFGTLRLIFAGVALGTAASLAGSPFNRVTSLFHFSLGRADVSRDGVGLVTVAMISGYFPARRAARVSPMSALRNS